MHVDDCGASMRPYRDFQDELLAVVFRLQGIENGRQGICVELDCCRVLASG
jgi:hypothetical protein